MAFVPGWLKEYQRRVEEGLAPYARKLHRLGLQASHLSIAQIPFALASAAALLSEEFLWAAVLLGFSLFLDVLDGLFARSTGSASARGHVMDKTMDLLGIYVFLVAALLARPALWKPITLTAAATAVLYVFGWYFDPELIPGVRTAGALWLLLPSWSWILWVPAVVGLVEIPYAVAVRSPKDAHSSVRPET